ncbi:PilZ domain-containing protein [Sphingosinicella sp. CPCC 101087]|uniref:PilZ domain-containing protein n=1 Tax=Sphingosinicella sp. CPCC 101087 TaxID=2497754 RepID=UPI00101CA4E1|nr:PilZ domain-containing protein [Sphingosinicella sp. CPCC 101087]
MQWFPAFARSIALSENLGENVARKNDLTGGGGTEELGDTPNAAGPAEESPVSQDAPSASDAVSTASTEPGSERRSQTRHDAGVMGRLRLPASEHDCWIVELSTGGMRIASEDSVVSVGEQVVVVTQNFPRLIGIARWARQGVIGIQFQRPIAPEVIAKMGEIRRRVRSPRAGRAKLELPSVVYFDGTQHDVVVGNISVGGLMMTTRLPVLRGQRKVIRDGQALMIQFPELLPIGGHVRWTCGARCGVAFSKLLPLPIAEEILRLGNLNPAWLDDVRRAHADFEDR